MSKLSLLINYFLFKNKGMPLGVDKLFSKIVCKNKYYIVVVLEPNFYLSAWSSLFFHQVYGEPF